LITIIFPKKFGRYCTQSVILISGLLRINRFAQWQNATLKGHVMSLVVKNTIQEPIAPLKAITPTQVLEPLSKAEKLKAAAEVTKEMNKDAEDILIQPIGRKTGVRLPSISTNLPTLDEGVITCGGIPRGRIVEVYGPESAGKTTFCLHIIGQAQKAGGVAAFVDATHALDPNYAAKLGVNMDELILSQPDYGEQAIQVVINLVERRAVDLIVIDDVTSLIPKAELEGEMTDASMGAQARLMSKAMRKLQGVAHKTGTVVMFINQVREKIGVMFGNPEVTTGGRALKFFSSVRLEVRRLSKTDGGEVIDPETKLHTGHRMKVVNRKNKVGPPFRETIIDLDYEHGIDTRSDLVQYAVNLGLVEDARGWFIYKGERYRKNQLTASPLFDTLKVEAMKGVSE
jgi:recombination protein RecA